MIGTAGDAIQRLTLPEADKAALINNIPVAYAVTYLVGTAALVWFIPTIGPKLMGVNLRDEGARMRANASSELLDAKIAALEANRPLARRRSRR